MACPRNTAIYIESLLKEELEFRRIFMIIANVNPVFHTSLLLTMVL